VTIQWGAALGGHRRHAPALLVVTTVVLVLAVVMMVGAAVRVAVVKTSAKRSGVRVFVRPL
jgi:hypothetical protein